MAQLAENYSITNVQPVAAQIENKENDNEKKVGLEKVQPVALHWTDFTNTPMSKVTWSHHIVLLDKTKSKEEYNYYLLRTISEGWSKRVLKNKIEQELFKSQAVFYQITLIKHCLLHKVNWLNKP
jgi:hypothetical protein